MVRLLFGHPEMKRPTVCELAGSTITLSGAVSLNPSASHSSYLSTEWTTRVVDEDSISVAGVHAPARIDAEELDGRTLEAKRYMQSLVNNHHLLYTDRREIL
jgi:hypothetical protein